jgi:hypothetical protein
VLTLPPSVRISLVANCEANDVNPIEYLRDVLLRISTHPTDGIDELLPDRWSPAESGQRCKGIHGRTLTFHPRPTAPKTNGSSNGPSGRRATAP